MQSIARQNSPRADVTIRRAAAILLPWSKQELEALLQTLMHHAGHTRASVELLVVTDEEMQKHTASAMHCQGPTNILSFPLHTAFPNGTSEADVPRTTTLGLLVLSAETLSRECFLYDQHPVTHGVRLLVHGFAHLLGYDHGDDMDLFCQQYEKLVY